MLPGQSRSHSSCEVARGPNLKKASALRLLPDAVRLRAALPGMFPPGQAPGGFPHPFPTEQAGLPMASAIAAPPVPCGRLRAPWRRAPPPSWCPAGSGEEVLVLEVPGALVVWEGCRLGLPRQASQRDTQWPVPLASAALTQGQAGIPITEGEEVGGRLRFEAKGPQPALSSTPWDRQGTESRGHRAPASVTVSPPPPSGQGTASPHMCQAPGAGPLLPQPSAEGCEQWPSGQAQRAPRRRRQEAARSLSGADLVHGEEPEEHRGGEQAYRGAERSPVSGAVRPEPGPHPKSCQHPPSAHGEQGAPCGPRR